MLQKEFLGPQKRKEEEMLLSMPRQKRKPKHLEEYEAEDSDDELKKRDKGKCAKKEKTKIKKQVIEEKENINSKEKSKLKEKKTKKPQNLTKKSNTKTAESENHMVEIKSQKTEEKNQSEAIKKTETDFMNKMMNSVYPKVGV